jgi:ribosomal protein S18 acetylase RimI-like enzyme
MEHYPMFAGVNIRSASVEEIGILETKLKADPDQRTSSVVRGVDIAGEHVFIIEYLGQVAGFCTYRCEPNEIFPLFIFTPFRRQGIGEEAMRQLIVLLQQDGRTEVFIEVINDAGPFWSKVFSDYQYTEHGFGKYTIDIS